MKENISRDDLRKLIAMGKEGQALQWMIDLSEGQSKEVQKLITLQSNRYQKLRKKRLEGSIDQASAHVMAAQISGDLFELLESFSFDPKKEDQEKKVIPVTSTWKSKLLPGSLPLTGIVLVALGLSILLGVFVKEMGIFSRINRPQLKTTQEDIGNNISTRGGATLKKSGITFQEWKGNWTIQMESTDNTQLEGTLTFGEQGGQQRGRFEFTGNGSEPFIMMLSNLVIHEEQQLISGTWAMEDVLGDPRGSFQFNLNTNQDSFSGSYSFDQNTDETFYWTGSKKH